MLDDEGDAPHPMIACFLLDNSFDRCKARTYLETTYYTLNCKLITESVVLKQLRRGKQGEKTSNWK